MSAALTANTDGGSLLLCRQDAPQKDAASFEKRCSTVAAPPRATHTVATVEATKAGSAIESAATGQDEVTQSFTARLNREPSAEPAERARGRDRNLKRTASLLYPTSAEGREARPGVHTELPLGPTYGNPTSVGSLSTTSAKRLKEGHRHKGSGETDDIGQSFNEYSLSFSRRLQDVVRDKDELARQIREAHNEVVKLQAALEEKNADMRDYRARALKAVEGAQLASRLAEDARQECAQQKAVYDGACEQLGRDFALLTSLHSKVRDALYGEEGLCIQSLESVVVKIRGQAFEQYHVAAQKIEDLETAVSRQQQTVQQALFDRATIQDKQHEAENAMRDKQTQYDQKCNELLTVAQDLAAQKKDNEHLAYRIEDLENKVALTVAEKAETARALQLSEAREIESHTRLAVQDKLLTEASAALKESCAREMESKDCLKELERKLQEAKAEVDSAQEALARCHKIEQNNAAAIEDLKQGKSEYETRLNVAEEQLRLHVEKVQQMAVDRKRDREGFEAKLQDADRQALDAKLGLEYAEKEAAKADSTYQMQINGLEQRNKELTEQTDRLQRQLAETRAAATVAEAQVVDLRRQLEVLTEAKESGEQSHEQLSELFDNLVDANKDALEELDEQKAENQELIEAKEDLTEQLENRQAQLAALREQLAHMETSLEELRATTAAELAQVRTSLESGVQEAAQDRDRVEGELKEERARLTLAAESHRDEKCRLEQELLTVRQELGALEARLGAAERQRDEAEEHKGLAMLRYKQNRMTPSEKQMADAIALQTRLQVSEEFGHKENEILRYKSQLETLQKRWDSMLADERAREAENERLLEGTLTKRSRATARAKGRGADSLGSSSGSGTAQRARVYGGKQTKPGATRVTASAVSRAGRSVQIDGDDSMDARADCLTPVTNKAASGLSDLLLRRARSARGPQPGHDGSETASQDPDYTPPGTSKRNKEVTGSGV
ncbi:unnamed protein product [Parajaminaea phylloscopi]